MRYSRAFVVWFWISSAVYVGYGAAWTQGRKEASSPAAGLALTGFVHLQDIRRRSLARWRLGGDQRAV